MPVLGFERTFFDITWRNTYLMESSLEVKLGEEFSTTETIKNVVCLLNRSIVMIFDPVQGAVVAQTTQLPLLLNEK